MSAQRSAREVIDDHLELARSGDFDTDLERNYHPDVVFFMSDGIYRGREGGLELAKRLEEELPGATFEYTTVLVEADVGFLEWTGRANETEVNDGADSFVVRDGLIVAQTIHYTVEPRTRAPQEVATDGPVGLHHPDQSVR